MISSGFIPQPNLATTPFGIVSEIGWTAGWLPTKEA